MVEILLVQKLIFYKKIGQCGDGSSSVRMKIGAVDTRGVLLNKVIIQVAASQLSSMALSSDGNVYTWGHNGNNQLCDGTTETRYLPVAVNTSITGVAKVVSIAFGVAHMVLLSADGKVYSCGHNTYGQLGDGTTIFRNLLVRTNLPFGVFVTSIFASSYNTMLVAANRTLYSVGRGDYGQNVQIDCISYVF